MKTPEYQLAKDVFACRTGNHLVFLDLQRNRYLCLNANDTRIAARMLRAFEDPQEEPEGPEPVSTASEAGRIILALREGGLLVGPNQQGNGATPVQVESPKAFLSPDHRQDTRLCGHHRAAFLHGSLKASAKLRWYSMHRTVQSIEKLKRRHTSLQPSGWDVLSELVRIFLRLRPFYPRRYLCLYDSLALIEFLAKYRYFPQWVFGVRTEPFNAHCWVQVNGYVLNDDVENVRSYTAIMAV